MKKIVALTDFSGNARHAAEYALQLVKKAQNGELVLLHTFEPPVLMTDTTGALAADGIPNPVNYSLLMEQADLMRKSAEEQISVAKNELEATQGSAATTIETIVEEGFLGDAANEISGKKAAELVVMGIKGKTGLEKIIMGSNALKAIGTIDAPLLIVPDGAPIAIPAKAALASDLSLLTPENLQQLHAFLNAIDVPSLSVVNVNMNKNEAINEERISALKAQLSKLNPVFHFMEAPHIEAGLETFVQENAISILIFIHHEKGFFANLFHKSISKQIAWHTT
ncbi:MAG: universal stress protein, partial [Niabella sp.]|nr:universal stress protein [Niabella sp.]